MDGVINELLMVIGYSIDHGLGLNFGARCVVLSKINRKSYKTGSFPLRVGN